VNHRQLRDQIARKSLDLQSGTGTFSATDEDLGSRLRSLKPAEMAWSDWLDLCRSVWEEHGLFGRRGVENTRPSQLVDHTRGRNGAPQEERHVAAFSQGGGSPGLMSDARRVQLAEGLLNAHKGSGRAAPAPVAFSLGLFTMGMNGMTPERKAEIIAEMERHGILPARKPDPPPAA
jgi:hypothetical protein